MIINKYIIFCIFFFTTHMLINSLPKLPLFLCLNFFTIQTNHYQLVGVSKVNQNSFTTAIEFCSTIVIR